MKDLDLPFPISLSLSLSKPREILKFCEIRNLPFSIEIDCAFYEPLA